MTRHKTGMGVTFVLNVMVSGFKLRTVVLFVSQNILLTFCFDYGFADTGSLSVSDK